MHLVSKTVLCVLLTLLVSTLAFSTTPGPKKSRYKARIYLHDGTVLKGRLYSAGDSSLTLHNGSNLSDEIRYNEIEKIRIRRAPPKGYALISGLIVTPIIFASITTANEPEPELRGSGAGFRFIGALLLGIVVGTVVGTIVDIFISRKKINVSQEPGAYATLKARLARYCLR